jgi:hypothetical protein
MILRFCSGSQRRELARKTLLASTMSTHAQVLAKVAITCAPRFAQQPVSTNMQVAAAVARWISAAATDESTPPERPRMTSSSPTCSRIFAIASST